VNQNPHTAGQGGEQEVQALRLLLKRAYWKDQAAGNTVGRPTNVVGLLFLAELVAVIQASSLSVVSPYSELVTSEPCIWAPPERKKTAKPPNNTDHTEHVKGCIRCLCSGLEKTSMKLKVP